MVHRIRGRVPMLKDGEWDPRGSSILEGWMKFRMSGYRAGGCEEIGLGERLMGERNGNDAHRSLA